MKQVQHNSGPGIVLGIPTLGRPVPLDWALSFKSLNPPINYNIVMQIIQGEPVDVARNKIAAYAISTGAKYLFFLGDDVVCPPHTLKQLIYRMEQDSTIGVVGGIYCSKCEPPNPLVFRGNGVGCYWDWKIGEFFEVTGLGMDCTLIRCEALALLGENPFKTVDKDSYIEGVAAAESWTEDLFFFKRLLEETSYKVYCDSMIMCDHYDVYTNKAWRLPADSLPMRQRIVTKDKRCLYIGPETIGVADKDFDIVHFGPAAADYRGSPTQLPFATGEFDWVIVTDLDDAHRHLLVDEWLRVAKGKVTLAYKHYFMNLPAISDYYNKMLTSAVSTVVEDKYIEVVRHGIS